MSGRKVCGVHYVIDGVGVNVHFPLEMTEEEVAKYVAYAREQTANKGELTALTIQQGKEPDEVTLAWVARGERFERIRRITGYLVGTIDRWNNAKRSEERDRVKHA